VQIKRKIQWLVAFDFLVIIIRSEAIKLFAHRNIQLL